MLVPRQPREQGMEQLCPSGGSNLIFEVIYPFHGSFALEGLVWKGKSQNQAGIPVGAEHTQVWGWGVEETPRPALGAETETTRDFWWIAELLLAENGRHAACDQISDAGTEQGTLKPGTRNVYGFPKDLF